MKCDKCKTEMFEYKGVFICEKCEESPYCSECGSCGCGGGCCSPRLCTNSKNCKYRGYYLEEDD